MADEMVKRRATPHFCYEARPTGYELYRQIIGLGHRCEVGAPSLILRRPGNRVKTNRRDAVSLARLHRADELTSVWVPDETHDAVRDLVRAHEVANDGLRKARQHLQSFLLRYGRIYAGRAPWTQVHSRSLAIQSFAQHKTLCWANTSRQLRRPRSALRSSQSRSPRPWHNGQWGLYARRRAQYRCHLDPARDGRLPMGDGSRGRFRNAGMNRDRQQTAKGESQL